jgi:LPXTG-motif cell wall-anchored protein
MMAVMAAPALAATTTTTVTQADCNAGRISRHGVTLTKAQCEALIGKRVRLAHTGVRLAHTGFEVWIIAAIGGALILGCGSALILRRRSSAGPALG